MIYQTYLLEEEICLSRSILSGYQSYLIRSIFPGWILPGLIQQSCPIIPILAGLSYQAYFPQTYLFYQSIFSSKKRFIFLLGLSSPIYLARPEDNPIRNILIGLSCQIFLARSILLGLICLPYPVLDEVIPKTYWRLYWA